MDEKQREVLRNCHDYLIENIRPLPVITNLYSVGTITDDDSIRLQSEATPNDQNRLLLVSMLPRAGPNAFSALITALIATGQAHVANHLFLELGKGTCICKIRHKNSPIAKGDMGALHSR